MKNNVLVKIFSKSGKLPEKSTFGAAAYDLRAFIENGPLTLKSGTVTMVPTGIFSEIAEGFHVQILSRSGLASKGIIVANAPGIVDSDYREEWRVLLLNLSGADFDIYNNDRIAQITIEENNSITWNECNSIENFSKTERTGGFGSTGIK